jgi:hypothetical protein
LLDQNTVSAAYAYETNAMLIVPEQIEESSECDLADFVDGINSLQHLLA